MARKADTPCAGCGRLLWGGTTSRPAGERRCLDCRRAAPKRSWRDVEHPCTCQRCGQGFTSTVRGQPFCSRTCYSQSRVRHPDRNTARRAAQATRMARIRAAGGLTTAGVKALLKLWKRQGRQCTYCGGPCQTVDHVIPLARGGTNFEGNLTPCCRSCNHRKGTRLVAEWLYSDRRTVKVLLCVRR